MSRIFGRSADFLFRLDVPSVLGKNRLLFWHNRNVIQKDINLFRKCQKRNFATMQSKYSIFPKSLKLLLFGGYYTGHASFCKLRFIERAQCQGKNDEQEKEFIIEEPDDKNKEYPFPWKEFFRLLIPDIWCLLGAIMSALAVAYINIQIPLLLGGIVNVVAKFTAENCQENFVEEVRKPALQLVQMYALQGLLTFVYISLLSTVGERVAARMRQKLFDAIIIQDVAFFDANRTGEILNRLTTDVQDFKSSFKMCISQGLKNMAQTIGCLVSLFVVSPKLTGLMAAVVTGLISAGSLMGSGLRTLSRNAQAQVAKSTVVAEEAIGNVRTVRSFAMESKEKQLFAEEIQHSSRLNQLLGFGIGLFQGLSNIALNGQSQFGDQVCSPRMVLGTLYVGGYLMSQKDVNAGNLMSFLIASQTIQRSLGQMSLLFGQAVRGLSAGSRVFEYMLLSPSMSITGGQTIPYHSLHCDIKFDHVNFTYPTRPNQVVLKNFSLSIPGGSVVALVGSSGGGKSTVAALLERFYDIDEGSITLDGIDLRSLDPSWLRGRVIGFINQEPVLFATSVMENIRYGNPGASNVQVIEAAKQANAHGFIESFPEGYDTILGERGVTVSGGQKQRIAIARALLKNPSILVLDEATSALDAESERIVQEALDTVIKGRTVLVIAHRLSTIRNADCIAVVADGRIIEMGKHEELKKKQGAYWELIRGQESSHNANRFTRNG